MIIEHFCVNPTIILLPEQRGNERLSKDQRMSALELLDRDKLATFWVKNHWVFVQAFFLALGDFR